MSTRTINVIGAEIIRSGDTNGKPWTLYEITAITEAGAPIDLKLKSFEKLAGVVEVEVEKQSHEKYGESYMLKKSGGGSSGGGSAGARLGPKVDELRTRVEELETQVEFMRRQISSLNATLVEGAAPAPAAPYGGDPIDPGRFGDPDDIPF